MKAQQRQSAARRRRAKHATKQHNLNFAHASGFLSIAVQFWISPAVNGQQRWITYMDKDNLAPQRKR